MDKSYGADGMVVRSNIQKVADLKGKTVAASAPDHVSVSTRVKTTSLPAPPL